MGLTIKQNMVDMSITIDQKYKIETMQHNCGISDQERLVPTPRSGKPIPVSQKLPEGVTLTKQQQQYATDVGVAISLARASRADCSEAAMALAPYARNPQQQHIDELRRLLCYIVQTKDYGIKYDGPLALQPGLHPERPQIFVDANLMNGMATIGVVVIVNGGVVNGYSKFVQRPVGSATEAEISAINFGVKEASYLKFIMKDLELPIADDPIIVFSDSKTAIAIANSDSTRTTTTHYLDKLRYVQHQRRENVVRLQHVKAEFQIADCLTKHVSGPKLRGNIQHFMVTK